jgi:hypothetical protein
MEVHHHPDLSHKKKQVKEYFLEFLMIFLAVTLGFFAESLRENMTKKEKEKDYINSFIKNLEDDTTNLSNTIDANQQKLKALQSLMSLSTKNISDPTNRKLFYKSCTGKSIGYYSVFKSNDATMLQLKNSGGLQVIRRDHVADSIGKYDNEVKYIYAAETLYWNTSDQANLATQDVLDYSIFYDTSYFNKGQFTNKFIPLKSDDPQKIKGLFNKVHYEIGGTRNYIDNLQRRLPFAIQLIYFLKKEYEIE